MPSIATTKLYEAVYILDPDSGEEQVNTVTNRYKELVVSNGGEVQKIDIWERRKLAYEVKGRTEGIYVVMHFTGEPKVEAELRRIFQISEDQLRYMIVKPEEIAPEAEVMPRRTAAAEPTLAPPAAMTAAAPEAALTVAVEEPTVAADPALEPAVAVVEEPAQAEPVAA